MTAGRPTSYRPEYCETVIELGKEGKSLVQMATACGCVRRTLHEWAEANEEFSQSLEMAKELSQAKWEQDGQDGLFDDGEKPKINASIYSRSMAARFPHDWTERRENKQDVSMNDRKSDDIGTGARLLAFIEQTRKSGD